MVNCRLTSEYTSELRSFLARSTFIFLMPVMSFDIFNSAIKSIFWFKNCSPVDERHCILIERVGAENVFESIFGSVRRSWTLLRSWIEIEESGWCCFLIVESWVGTWLAECLFTVLENKFGGAGGGTGMFELLCGKKDRFTDDRIIPKSLLPVHESLCSN